MFCFIIILLILCKCRGLATLLIVLHFLFRNSQYSVFSLLLSLAF
ncbi:hypothetical protein HMPREF3226_00725 [Prevotella corporis]|uniref:Uncharacterized protein n=1 Tax=Prevotella corporis TaxID=28128 RepID=A0A133QHL3_9BACT|nr:hypothetical protein HMPREF3226_00725 [Prevotella corporis]